MLVMYEFIKMMPKHKYYLPCKGDIIVLKYSNERFSTGHAMICWENTKRNWQNITVLESSCRLGKIGISKYTKNELKNSVMYRMDS